MTAAPDDVVASFDSASVLHAAGVAAVNGRAFRHLGNSEVEALAIRLGGRLPWPLLSRVYARFGASEGIATSQLGEVDLGAVARWFADGYPPGPYPAVFLGSSNGAVSHLAAAVQAPWLPATVLVPVAHEGERDRPDRAMEFGRRAAPDLLARNPDVVLHQMHDAEQDALMVRHMTYFRTKWRGLPDGYADFLRTRLAPGAPVVVVTDTSTWPVTRVDERHVFQVGGQGGMTPEEYLARPHAPVADDEAAEAEWGLEPEFLTAVEAWCRRHQHPLVRLTFAGPQGPAHAVAATVGDWYAGQGVSPDRLLVPSFVLGDPWTTLTAGLVPYWTFFGVRPALSALAAHLERSAGYREAHVMIFQHGALSPGRADPADFRALLDRHGVDCRFVALDERKSPRDIAAMARYAGALRRLVTHDRPWEPLAVDAAVSSLRRHADAADGLVVDA